MLDNGPCWPPRLNPRGELGWGWGYRVSQGGMRTYTMTEETDGVKRSLDQGHSWPFSPFPSTKTLYRGRKVMVCGHFTGGRQGLHGSAIGLVWVGRRETWTVSQMGGF